MSSGEKNLSLLRVRIRKRAPGFCPICNKPLRYEAQSPSKSTMAAAIAGRNIAPGRRLNLFALTKGFGQFPLADHPPRLVLEAIGGLGPQVNPVSMVSDA